MNTGVYCIKNETNGKLYIGSTTTNFNQRKREHFLALKKNKHHSIYLQRAWNKYGQNTFNFIILEKNIPSECIHREQWFLDNWPCDYNICKIAGSSLGVKRNEDTKRKLSLIHIGLFHTLETKEKIRKTLMGRKILPEWIAKQKISMRPYYDSVKIPIKQIDKRTNQIVKIWPSLTEAASSFSNSYEKIQSIIGHISAVCKKRKSHHTACGFKWEYNQ